MDQIELARDSARQFIEELNSEEFLSSSAHHSPDSFIALVSALTFATQEHPVSQ